MTGNVIRGDFESDDALRAAVANEPPAWMDEAADALFVLEQADRVADSDDNQPAASAKSEVPVAGEGVTFDDFYAYMPDHRYIFAPARDFWAAASIDARLPRVIAKRKNGSAILNSEGKPTRIKASTWLDRNRPVEQTTWAPGFPMVIEDRLVSDGGWIARRGVSCFNLYRPPIVAPGDAGAVKPWLDHVQHVYPDDWKHIVAWLAQRVQHPEVKINHALVLGGNHGVGKDTILDPVKYAVGPWNFSEIAPSNLLGRFNGFLKSVVLRISEARDLGDVDRFAFYDHSKTYLASPPDVLRVDEKNIREHSIFNVTGVIITTNHKTDGIYLPADDRRHYVAWTDIRREEFPKEYWNDLYAWYDRSGRRNVAAFLALLDISEFDPKAPPPKTEAFWAIVNSNRAPEDAEMSDILDRLNTPKVLTIQMLARESPDDEFRSFLTRTANRKRVSHRLEEAGYEPVRNPDAEDGLWRVGGKRATVYGRNTFSISDLLAATYVLIERQARLSPPRQ